MKVKSKNEKSSDVSLALPGKPVSEEVIINAILIAEKGPFFSSNELKEKFSIWKKENFK